MRKYLLLLLLTAGCLLQGRATHIVGGEFELTHISGRQYKLTLNLYFDVAFGSVGARDTVAVSDIYRKSNNQKLQTVRLPYRGSSRVQYTNPICAVGDLITDKLVYWRVIELDPLVYTDPAGYYVAWERCCRNHAIDNIVDPGATGQTFYLEFPPVRKNGQPFINSSPVLFPPLSDYACRNELFYFDFSGSDPDGDSLAYFMAEPLRGFSTAPNPIPATSPGPYPVVQWLPGYSLNNQVLGLETLHINPVTGLLRVNADQTGLFVFAIRCDEFRNGVKIGEVRREFQLLVLNCPTNAKPDLTAQHAQTPGVFYQPADTIVMEAGISRCFNLFVADPDPNEVLTITVKPLNFSAPGLPLQVTGTINNAPGNDTLQASFCLPWCLPAQASPYLIEVIVKDDGCSVPKQDTLRIKVLYKPLPNQPPVVSTSLPANVVNAVVGDVVNFDVFGLDPDAGLVVLSASGQGFNLSSVGINFPQVAGVGQVTGPFNWTVPCLAAQMSPFTVNFTVIDTTCNNNKTDVIQVVFNITGLPNALPSATSAVLAATVQVGQTITFPVTATDPDVQDQLTLLLEGQGFNPASLGMQFPTVTGPSALQGIFSWTPGCNALSPGTYELLFIARDSPCSNIIPDTVRVVLTVEYQNQPPSIAGGGLFAEQVGQSITIPFTAQDPDNHPVTITVEGNGIDLAAHGISFTPVSGVGQVTANVIWTPNCLTAALPEDLHVWVIVTESACEPNRSDSTELILHTLYQNTPPALSLHPEGLHSQPLPEELVVIIGEPVTFDVLGRDLDPNLLTLSGAGEGFSLAGLGMQFSPATGTGEVLSTFAWTPRCETGGPGVYRINFDLSESTCVPEDTATFITIRVVEREAEQAFNPVNIFTPNGDGKNDVFEMPTLPLDVCDDKFVQIVLFNRWGSKVYGSPSRNFRWDGANAPEGIYYYRIEFQKKEYKGYVTLVR